MSSNQMDLWSGGEALKEEGLDSVETKNKKFVDIMRARATELCLEFGRVTSDDLRRYAMELGIRPEHPNAWGSVFRGKKWTVVGRMKSKLASNHAREIRVWALSGK